LSSRYRFHGFAVAAAGRIDKPFTELIEAQAATALPQLGGHGTARVAAFKRREALQFDLALSEVTGEDCDCEINGWSAATRLQSTIEGLNIMGMVTADRVVANLVSTTTGRSDGEPSVKLLGTRFEGLKIAGVPVEVDLSTSVLDRYDTHSSLTEAYRADGDVRKMLDAAMLRGKKAEVPEHVSRWFRHTKETDDLPHFGGTTSVSLVRNITPGKPGLRHWGHVVHVDGFGTVRLAEVDISRRTRVVNMIQVEFDCPYEGKMMCLSVGDGGEPNGQLDA